MKSRTLEVILVISFGYLFGSILFANLIGRALGKPDVRQMGDGNPGASNIFMNMNRLLGIVVAVSDSFKSIIPMALATAMGLSTLVIILAGSAAVVGHCFPIYYGFRGGRGVATASGVLAFLIPKEFFASLGIATLSMFFIKSNRQHIFPGITVGLAIISSFFLEQSRLFKISFLAIGIFLGFANLPRFLVPAKVPVPEEEQVQ